MSHSLERFLGNHTAEEMINWAKRLRYFYLFGNFFSGQMEFYESLVARIDFKNKEDLIEKMSLLVPLHPTPPQLNAFESPISDYSEYLQPSYCQISECPLERTNCHIWVSHLFFKIRLFGNGEPYSYDVSEENVIAASKVEQYLEKQHLHLFVNHEIATHFNCISAKNYPFLFGSV